jgi:hypothetical protein
MTHETPHQEAPASLADGLAAIARELRAMARAQQAEAGIAAAMHAAVLCLLVSFLVRLADMAEAWQQGRLTLPPASNPAIRYKLSTRPDSLHRLARLARRVASRRARQTATKPARPPRPLGPASPRPRPNRTPDLPRPCAAPPPSRFQNSPRPPRQATSILLRYQNFIPPSPPPSA